MLQRYPTVCNEVGVPISNTDQLDSGKFCSAMDSPLALPGFVFLFFLACRFRRQLILEKVSGMASVSEDQFVLPEEQTSLPFIISYSVVTQGPLCRRNSSLASAPEHSLDNVRLSLAMANFRINSLLEYVLNIEIHFRGTFNIMVSFQLLGDKFPLVI